MRKILISTIAFIFCLYITGCTAGTKLGNTSSCSEEQSSNILSSTVTEQPKKDYVKSSMADRIYDPPKEDKGTILKRTLHYQRTRNIMSPIISSKDASLNEREYDIYEDEEKTEYIYFGGTNKLCGIKQRKIYNKYVGKDGVVSKDIALETGEECLKTYFPEWEQYHFLSCNFAELEGVYVLQYMRYLEGLPTDDYILMYICANGTLGTFTAFRRGLYDNVTVNKRLLKEKLENPPLPDDKEMKLVKTFIAFNRNKLSLVFEYGKENTSPEQLAVIIE